MATTGHGLIVTPDPGGVVNVPTALSAMSASLEPTVVGYYADVTARDAGTLAMRTALKKGMKCFVLSLLDWQGWNGTEWISEHPAPVFHQTPAIGPSHGVGSGFTNTAQAKWDAADATITLTRRGMCTVGIDYDFEVGAAGGFGAATGYVRVDGSYITDGFVTFQAEQAGGGSPGGSRRIDRYTCRVPIMLAAGSHTLWLDVAKFGGSGSWRFNSFGWKVTQL
jgi:hypothetical protein